MAEPSNQSLRDRTSASTEFSIREATGAWAKPPVYAALSIFILALDLLSGRWLMFPILFVIPVCISGWHLHLKWAYGLAISLPLARGIIAWFEDGSPIFALAVNALVRMAVLMWITYLISRTARQTRKLEEQMAGLVKVCAWSRTIEYEGEWLSIEEYLKRRFNLDTSHGISPTEAEKFLAPHPANHCALRDVTP